MKKAPTIDILEYETIEEFKQRKFKRKDNKVNANRKNDSRLNF